MSDADTPRRYYLLKRMSARLLGDLALSAVWQAKQLAEPGTALPSTFPLRIDLAALDQTFAADVDPFVYGFYTTREDLLGADTKELGDYAGLTQREAETVIAAVAAL